VNAPRQDATFSPRAELSGLTARRQEEPMELPEDIRREIEASGDREVIEEIVTRLQKDGVKITRDVLAAIKMTMSITEGVVE
jgi:hypothetical protein